MGMAEHLAGQLVNGILRMAGYQVVRYSSSVSWQSAFARIKKQHVELQTVIDVGASDGRWSRTLWHFYPTAFYLLIEANKVHEPKLETLRRRFKNVDYTLAAAGDVVGTVYFDASDPSGGLASHKPLTGEKVVRVPVTTVDNEVEAKLDFCRFSEGQAAWQSWSSIQIRIFGGSF